MSFNINSKTQEIVERSEVLDQMLLKGSASEKDLSEALSIEINESGDTLEVTDSLMAQLSERGEMIAELGDSAFAPASNTIGNFTFGSLGMLISEVGSTLTKDFSLTTMLPDLTVEEFKVMVERVSRVAGQIADWAPNAEFPAVRPLDTYAYEFEPAFNAGEVKLGAQEIFYARKKGGGNFKDRGLRQLVAMNSVNLLGKINAKKKNNIVNTLLGNGFQWLGQTFAAGIPSQNVWSPPSAWWTVSKTTGVITYNNTTSYPLIDLASMISSWIALLPYRHAIKAIVFSYQDLVTLLNHPNVSDAYGSGGLKNYLAMSHDNNFFKNLGDRILSYVLPSHPDVKLIADKDIYVPEAADGSARFAYTVNGVNVDPLSTPTSGTVSPTSFIPSGNAMIILDMSDIGAKLGAYHLTINPSSSNFDKPMMGYNLEVKNVVNQPSSAPSISIVGSLAGAPAIYMPEAVFIMNGFIKFV